MASLKEYLKSSNTVPVTICTPNGVGKCIITTGKKDPILFKPDDRRFIIEDSK